MEIADPFESRFEFEQCPPCGMVRTVEMAVECHHAGVERGDDGTLVAHVEITAVSRTVIDGCHLCNGDVARWATDPDDDGDLGDDDGDPVLV